MTSPAPWWWLDEAERRALGLGPGARRSELGVVFGEGGGPHRIELVPGGLDAPVRLGPVSLRLWGPPDAAGRALLGAAAARLRRRLGAAFDPREAGQVHAPPRPPAGAGHDAPGALVRVPSCCDRACVFCGASRTPVSRRTAHGPPPEAAVDAASGPVLLTGDDAAGYPGIEALVRRAARRGPVSLIGPPRAGREPSLAPVLAAAGLARWTSGLFGSEAAGHDAVAGAAGAFDALTTAIGAYAAAGVRVELVTPLVVPVLPRLAAIAGRAAALTHHALVLQAYVPDTDVGDAFDALVPDFRSLREALAAVPPGPQVRHDGLPRCVVPLHARAGASGWLDRSDPALEARYPAACRGCAGRDRCPGVAASVLRAVGDAGLAPLAG